MLICLATLQHNKCIIVNCRAVCRRETARKLDTVEVWWKYDPETVKPVFLFEGRDLGLGAYELLEHDIGTISFPMVLLRCGHVCLVMLCAYVLGHMDLSIY